MLREHTYLVATLQLYSIKWIFECLPSCIDRGSESRSNYVETLSLKARRFCHRHYYSLVDISDYDNLWSRSMKVARISQIKASDTCGIDHILPTQGRTSIIQLWCTAIQYKTTSSTWGSSQWHWYYGGHNSWKRTITTVHYIKVHCNPHVAPSDCRLHKSLRAT